MVSRNSFRIQRSTEASNESSRCPSPTSAHETDVHTSPPSSEVAKPSTSHSYRPRFKSKSKLPSYRPEGKPTGLIHKIQAIEGESVASRHNIGTASIDCEFYKIEHGQFKGKPACIIIIDVRLVYPPDNTIDSAKLDFQFAEDNEQNTSSEDHD